MNTTVACLFVGLISLAADAQMKKADISGIKNKFLNIPYATVSHAQELDIYLPHEGNGPSSVILSIHGGHGPPGAVYPDVTSGMQGETSSFFLIPNGLKITFHKLGFS